MQSEARFLHASTMKERPELLRGLDAACSEASHACYGESRCEKYDQHRLGNRTAAGGCHAGNIVAYVNRVNRLDVASC